MRKKELLKTLPALVASFVLSAGAVNALGSHGGNPNPGSGGGSNPHGAGTTFITPLFCLPGTEATDATAAFSTIGNGNHGTTILTLTIPNGSNTDAAYGNVRNNATQTFSSLAFDASSTNSDAVVEVFVAQANGLNDGGFAEFAAIATTATSTTPSGYTHCVATPANLELFNPSDPFGTGTTFLSAALLQFRQPGAKRSTNVANVNLNNSSTIAAAVMQQALDNCIEFDL